MAFLIRDFVKETTTVTGTGPATLLGARSPGQRFGDTLSNGDTCDYAISHDTSNEWEVGTGTYNANVLTRTTVTASSNGGAAVNFSIGTKRVDLVDRAGRIAQRVGPVVIGATTLGLGSLSFSNGSGVSFGLSTDSNGGTITASVGAGGGAVSFSAGGSSAALASLVFSNSNGLSFGLNGSTLTAAVSSLVFSASNNVIFGLAGSTVTASAVAARVFALGTFGSTDLSGFTETAASWTSIRLQQYTDTANFSFNNISWGYSGSLMAAVAAVYAFGANTAGVATSFGLQNFSMRNTNGVSWTLRDSTFANFGRIVRLEASVNPDIGVVSHVGGNAVSNVTQLAFSNASNVTWSVSTAANAATVFASVAAGGGGGADGFGTISLVTDVTSTTPVITAATDSSISGSLLAFGLMGTANNTNVSVQNVGFRLTSNTLLAAAWMNFSANSGGVSSAQNLSFGQANGMSWGMSSTTVANVGRVMIVTGRGAIGVSAGTLFQFAQNIALADAPGLSWTYGGVSAITPVPLNSGLHVVSDSLTSNNFSRLAFSAANGLTLGISTGASAATVTGSYTVPAVVNSGLLDLTNAASSVGASRLAFSNANGFSWLLSTGGSVGTLSASYTVPTLTSLSFSNVAGGVSFGIAGSTLTAVAPEQIGLVSHVGGQSVADVTRLVFENASNVTFSLSTAAGAATLQASVAAAGGGVTHSGFLPYFGAAVIVTQSLSNGSFWVQPLGHSPAFQFDRLGQLFGLSNATNATNSNTLRLYAGLYSKNGSSLSLLGSSSTSIAFTGSGTVGNYSLFSNARNVTMGWTSTIPESDLWIGVGASQATAGNNSYSVSFGMLSQTLNIAVFDFGAASNASYQSNLGKGFLSATTSAPPSSIAFSQIQGTNSVAYRFPALYFGSGTA